MNGAYCLALMMSTNSGFRDAPPTRKPSTSGWLANSLQVAPVTEPEKTEERVNGQGWDGHILFPPTCLTKEAQSSSQPTPPQAVATPTHLHK